MSEIPDVALLAAQAAVFDAMIEYGPDGRTDGHDKIARAALKAAAPILEANAWDEGWQKACSSQEPAMAGIFLNPYREFNRKGAENE